MILPSSLAMAMWLPLIYAGGRAAGIEDMRDMARETLVPFFPDDYPDTVAGHESIGMSRHVQI